jgi:hypothetical protein
MSKKEKHFVKTSEEIRERLVSPMGYCFASDRIMVDGLKVGYMYRENPDNDQDSGWRFFAGDEDDDYANTPENLEIYDLNTIAHCDKEIIPFLEAPYGTAFGKNDNGVFEEEPFEPPLD